MKEATGEANMTVVTIILIAAIVAIATPLLSSMMTNTSKKGCCVNAGGTMKNSTCVDPDTGSEISNYWDSDAKECKY